MTKSPNDEDGSISVLFGILFITAIIMTIPIILITVLTDTIMVEAQGPDIEASNVYETKSMSLGNNFKNLVILVPNEAHESQNTGDSTSEQRHINQPYIPWHATVSKGTAIMWFNGDVDHDHKITLTRQDSLSDGSGSSNSNLYFDSDTFAYNTATQPVVMNDTGSFYYSESDVNNEDPAFVMNGTINVVDQPGGSSTAASTSDTIGLPGINLDTIGTLMVPTEDLATHTSDLENRGFSVLSTHNFDDIRSEDQQTLIVWEASSGTNSLENIASHLSEITPTLPYS
jgi:hypothetical protein